MFSPAVKRLRGYDEILAVAEACRNLVRHAQELHAEEVAGLSDRAVATAALVSLLAEEPAPSFLELLDIAKSDGVTLIRWVRAIDAA